MKLLILPDDGFSPLVNLLKSARVSIDTTIFRLDRPEIEKALGAAVGRGVRVRALIAHTNREGEKQLRKLELRMLGAGVVVARTSDDLARYHDKLLIIDGKQLTLMCFNYTTIDQKSRSFALVTRHRATVQDAERLFEADMTRQPFAGAHGTGLIISPDNARPRLAAFLKKAKKELLIYDPKVADPAMLRLLDDLARRGVEVRILGTVAKRGKSLLCEKVPSMRLHTRAIVVDGKQVFLGSQSLRAAELDARREVGIIVKNPRIAGAVKDVFEKDWQGTSIGKKERKVTASMDKDELIAAG
jgi:cardiolipin synthase A/B